jgi:hypothetical protein
VRFASHFSLRLLDEIDRLSEQSVPIAEINRRVGARAQRLGATKPSYERVRQLVHEARELRRGYVSALQINFEVATLQRSPRHYEKLVSLPPRPRLRDRNRL